MSNISTWDELLATVAGEEYIWTGGDLDFNEIMPTGFTSNITINGSIDFNGAIFSNFRSMAVSAIISNVNTNVYKQYLKNLTFQNAEHLCNPGTTTPCGFFNTSCDWFENIILTGSIVCDNSVSRYSLIRMPAGQTLRHRVDRFGCDLTVRTSCPFFMSSNSISTDPSTGSNAVPLYDSRIKLDLQHTGSKPFFNKMYNSKISGKIQSSSNDATLPIEAYCSTLELEADRTINLTGSTNVVRSDMATYAENSSPIVRCDSAFSNHKAAIAASGFPYNGE